ncbi:phage tail protein [Tateyamaria sp. ANG-S1]|uniref:phage tail protein n=1 Tax=Tateyamaria sp. ANG-S1 TaxID=1577905 RepID=UPI00057FF7B0|nr:phage tail protein [Tateyamaria sp. ANG-S1]KIC50130.1 hypothetical protein RA29_11135 [Tateyamaria sp. ANG-S1]
MADDPKHTLAFVFRVTVGDATTGFAAQEVSGLETKLDTETVVEGGENRFVHQLPKPVKRANVTIKRCVLANGHPVVAWTRDTLEGSFAKPITPNSIAIDLLNDMQDVVASWMLHDAYPVKWSVGDLDAMKNEITVEQIEFAYSDIVRQG